MAGKDLTPRTVAEWMLSEVEQRRCLAQETAVSDISTQFGQQFTYQNENGNWAISRNVLAEFRKISGDKVVWERSERQWRKRQTCDSPGRQQE
jgi:hypothetical protein